MKPTAKEIASQRALKQWSEGLASKKIQLLKPVQPAPEGIEEIKTGFGTFTIHRDKFGRAFIPKQQVIRWMKQSRSRGDYVRFYPGCNQFWRDIGAILFDNSEVAYAALVETYSKDRALYRKLIKQTGAAYQAGFWYAVLSLAGNERGAGVGKKVLRSVKGPRKPGVGTVPNAILKIDRSRKMPVNKLAAVLQSQFPKMTRDNIIRQIRKSRKRAKKSDSKA